jgi:tetratricopeptide (TPR) repeat protein
MTTEQLNTLLQQGRYRELLPLAEKERKAHPDEPVFAVIATSCLNSMGKHGKARNLARTAIRKFPDDPQLQFELGQAHLALGESEDAEKAYLRAVELIGETSNALKSSYLTCLGGAQWALHKREIAIETWRNACALDPGNETARQMLNNHLNQYGEPRAPNPVFDDLYHFHAIHKARYFASRGIQNQEFKTKEEFEHVHAALTKAWNDQITPHKDRMDAMSAAEKTELFSSVQIDFTEEIPPSDMARELTNDELAAFQVRKEEESEEPIFEEIEQLTNLMFSIPLLARIGFPQRRLDEIIAGSAPTPQEEETLAWATDIVAAVFDAVEYSGAEEEVEAMMDAVAFACERLATEDAPSAVRDVRRMIETFIAQAEKGAKARAQKKKKRKK